MVDAADLKSVVFGRAGSSPAFGTINQLRFMLETTANIRVRFSETDAMGVVYHANYLPWCEVARTQLLTEVGLPYAELQDLGFLLPVLEINLKYRTPARFDDEVQIRAQMREMPRVKIRIDYEIRRGNELLTSGYTLHAFMNREGQAIKPPAFFIEKLQQAFDSASLNYPTLSVDEPSA